MGSVRCRLVERRVWRVVVVGVGLARVVDGKYLSNHRGWQKPG